MKEFSIREISIKDPAYQALARDYGTVFNDPDLLSLYGPNLSLYGIYDPRNTLIGAFTLYTKHIAGLKYVTMPPYFPHNALITDRFRFQVSEFQGYRVTGLQSFSNTGLQSSRVTELQNNHNQHNNHNNHNQDTNHTHHTESNKHNNHNHHNNHNNFTKTLHSALANSPLLSSPPLLQFGLPPEEKDVQPYLWKGYKVSPTYTYQIDLEQTEELILAGFDARLKRNIAKAVRDGLVVRKAVEMGEVRDLVEKRRANRVERREKRREGSVESRESLVSRILREYTKEGRAFGVVAEREGKVLSVVYCVYDRTTVYYILGGYDKKIRQRGAASLAFQGAIMHAKSLGLKVFDFEGSMVPSIELFFRAFGGQLVPKFTIHKAWLPLEVILKFFKRSIY